MKVRYHRNFRKQFRKLPATKQALCEQRLLLWQANPNHPLLGRHVLKGQYRKHYSLNAGGDLRIIYKQTGAKEAEFIAVGTHSQLYR